MYLFSDWFDPEETQQVAGREFMDARMTVFNPTIPQNHPHNYIAFSRPGEYAHFEGAKPFEDIVRLMIEGLF